MTIQRIAELETTMKRLLPSLPIRFRPFVRHRDTLPRSFMVTGPRGVRKTTFLLHHAQKLMHTQQHKMRNVHIFYRNQSLRLFRT